MKPTNSQNWRKANYRQAEGLLRDKQLIWSGDFEQIRLPLADIFTEHLLEDNYSSATLTYLAERLLVDENDLSI